MNKYSEFDNYLKEFPTKDGYFGEYGGAFISPELIPAFEEANNAGRQRDGRQRGDRGTVLLSPNP